MTRKEKDMRPPRFPGIDWYCDKCGSLLNSQQDFDDHHYVWKCTNCGYKNSISKANIVHDSKLKKSLIRVLELLIAYVEEIAFIGFFGRIIGQIISIITKGSTAEIVMAIGFHNAIAETAMNYMVHSILVYPIMLLISFFCQKFLCFYSYAYRSKSFGEIIRTNFIVDLTFPLYIVFRWSRGYKESRIGSFIKKTLCFIFVWLFPILLVCYGIATGS